MLRILVYSLIPLVVWKACNAYHPLQLRVAASPFDADQRACVIEVLTKPNKKTKTPCEAEVHCPKTNPGVDKSPSRWIASPSPIEDA